jgi:branched-chain amino acid transport system permease protein
MDMIADFLQAIPYDQLLIQTVNGIVTGMILALIASGLTLIFGIMDVVNFAHGELFMFGAYLGVLVLAASGSFWLALLLASLIVALIGAALQITTLRPLLGRDPLTTILATFGISLVMQNYALWQFGPVARKIQEPFTGHFTLFYLQYPWYRLVIAGLSAGIIGVFWLFLKYGTYGIWIRATTQDRVMAQAMGIPVPWVHTFVFAIGRRQRRAVRPAGWRQPRHGARLGAESLHCRGGGRHGQSGGLDRRVDLHQPARGLCFDLGQPGAGGDRLFRGSHCDLVVSTHRPVRTDTEMSKRHAIVYWTGFCVILALLAVAPLVLPEFWRRFLTEILIWGLLAMSSDILIGYTGMVSFGHSAFFGLGMYGAAAALLMVKPPNLWLAIIYGLIGSAGVALFVAYFSTRLRDIYFAITTLIFSQIFYVVIFTWTEVTGGENGLTFSRPALAIPGLFSIPFTSDTLHWFVLALVTASYLILRRITQSPFGMVLQSIRENEARTRAIGYPVERYKIVAVMLSGLFAGLAGVLYAIQNRFAAPDFVYFLVSGETVIFNVMGGIGTLVGPILGAGFFLLLREAFSRFFTEYYLIPVGIIFIVMVIFMPQGLLGFMRRWLNR